MTIEDIQASIVLQYATLKVMVDNLLARVDEVNAKLDALIPKIMTTDEAAEFAKQMQERADKLKAMAKEPPTVHGG